MKDTDTYHFMLDATVSGRSRKEDDEKESLRNNWYLTSDLIRAGERARASAAPE